VKKEIILIGVLTLVIVVLICVLIFLPGKTGLRTLEETSGLNIISPIANTEVSSPLEIIGVVSGNGWAGFEGQVGTVKLLDKNGKQISIGILGATTDWMTLPTSFKTILNFKPPETEVGTLLFENENTSGLPEKGRLFSLPVKFSKKETTEVEIFFGNMVLSSSNEQDECKRVYKTFRYVPKTLSIAKVAIEELLRGPTDAEMLSGFFTSIPAGSKLNNISIKDGIAYVNFDETTESGGGSCSMASRVAQITQTLMQFPTIKSIVISINGRIEDIFQP